MSAVSAVVIGALLKLSSPGLWARSGKRGVGGYSTGLTDTEKLILKVASVFSDYPVLYPLISIGLIASVVSVSYVSKSLSIFTAGWRGFIFISTSTISLTIWTLIAWRHRLQMKILFPRQEEIPHLISPAVLALLILSVFIFVVLLLILIIFTSRQINNPLPVFFYCGAMLSLLATAVMSHHLYSPLRRAHYVTLLFLAIATVILLAYVVSQSSSILTSPLAVSSVSIVILLSVIAGLNVTNQLIQNRLAWAYTEAEIYAAKAGNTDTIRFPNALPCYPVTWYWWPEDADDYTLGQLRIYYGIPSHIKLEVINQDRVCLTVP